MVTTPEGCDLCHSERSEEWRPDVFAAFGMTRRKLPNTLEYTGGDPVEAAVEGNPLGTRRDPLIEALGPQCILSGVVSAYRCQRIAGPFKKADLSTGRTPRMCPSGRGRLSVTGSGVVKLVMLPASSRTSIRK